ncbi:zinc finger (Ran-binding) family protein [Actinidia rufa]|uniref:Zinc finger (Ran-binding) family protein n=1 Tax=Actinidia rufa TaxID=165716 RepID=A0A7J0F152_9ERIC|nr:zinc finger (Ran-binding) family protein [Actinidia rufa]
MAQSTIFSLLLLRCLSSRSPTLLRPTRTISLFHPLTPKPFSSSSSIQTNTATSPSDPKPSSLSARMSFVFDQIDAIERERSHKDDALQRIRAWRESKKSKADQNDGASGFGAGESKPSELGSVRIGSSEMEVREKRGERKVEVVHPWTEWIELMERLVQQNYFDHRRKDEEKMVEDLGFQMPAEVVDEEGFDFTRDWKSVQTACLNFGRDRFDIMRSLSRQDIQILVGYGCPSADKKVVFSAKLLRKHVHLDEGDVCSSCSLRNSCEKAYLLTNKEDEARTIDIMRVLLTYGFDPMNGSVVNEPLLKIKSVKTVVRKLLHEVVKLSAVPIDPNLPPPIIKKPPPKVKQPPPPPKKRVGRDDIEMKKGDWLCPKCNFLNYRRNMVCFHCEHKRPLDEFMENQLQDRQRGPKTKLEKVPSRAEVSNAWNFDFDDNESDGADVAAFEYADSQKLDEDFPLDKRAQAENLKGPDDDSYASNRTPRARERENYGRGHKKPGTGFDDFDDEDDDDVDSYELDTQSSNQVQRRSSIDFSEVEGTSESDDVEDFDADRITRQSSSWSRDKPSKRTQRKSTLAGSDADEQDFDSDNELPAHPDWKSSHVADSRQRTRGRGAVNYSVDEDYGIGSDTDDSVDSDFGSRQNRGDKWGSSSRNSRKRLDSDGESFSSLESDGEDLPSSRNRFGGSKVGPNKRGNNSKGRGNFKLNEGSRFGSDSRKPFDNDFNRSSQRSRGNNGGSQRENFGGRRTNDRDSDSRNFRGRNSQGFGNKRRGGFNDYNNRSDNNRDFDDERPRRPRINVR